MKNHLILLFSLLIFAMGFSQDSNYDWLIRGKIKKEKLAEAKFMFDVIPSFPKGYFANLINYVSVEILATCEGKTLTSVSSNEVLTAEQKSVLNTADFGTDIIVSIKFSYKDSANDAYGGGGRIKEITPLTVMVVPEIEAEYPGGYYHYLNESVINKTSDIGAVAKIQNAIVHFTVNEAGEIVGAKIFRSSTDPKIDELILEATAKMPKWSAAQNSKGVKVKQVFSYPFRRSGC